MNTIQEIQHQKMNLEELHFDYEGDVQEVLYLFPESTKPTAAVIYIHGDGGSAWKSLPRARELLRQGYAVCLPSMRGYGASTGEPDFMGVKTLSAIRLAAELFCKDKRVDSQRVAIEGASRGAIVAAQLIAGSPLFAAAILESGAYDLEIEYKHNPPKSDEVLKRIVKEVNGDLLEGLRARSALPHANTIHCPTLILHGETDDVFLAEQAEMFGAALGKYNVPNEVQIIAGAGHHLLGVEQTQKRYVFPFLAKYLV